MTGIPGQAVLTEDEYFTVLLSNLRQLWTDYGPLAEVSIFIMFPEFFNRKNVEFTSEFCILKMNS